LILCERHLIADDKETASNACAGPLDEENTISVLGLAGSFEVLVTAEGSDTRSPRADVRAADSDRAQDHRRPLPGTESPISPSRCATKPSIAGNGHALIVASTGSVVQASRSEAGREGAMSQKILVVDDSPTTLMMVPMILGRAQYQFLTAGDGREALDLARREKPDLVVMGVILPRMTGFEACRELRADREASSIPIILMTEGWELDSVRRCFESGCSDIVTKPIDGLELLAKVQGFLGGRRFSVPRGPQVTG